VFEQCDFLLGQDNAIAIVIPAKLPPADTYTVSVSEKDVKFRAGFREIASIPFQSAEVLSRLSVRSQVGLVEYPKGQPFPDCITALAYVELRRAS
jgi:hypothetical protein